MNNKFNLSKEELGTKEYQRRLTKAKMEKHLCLRCNQVKTENRWNKTLCEECTQRVSSRFKRWRNENPEKEHKRNKTVRQRMRLKALQKISGQEIPKCFYCNCQDMRVLEINHKNCDRRKRGEHGTMNYSFWRKIVRGERDTKDLEVVCKLHNWSYYLEKEFGLRFQITFLGRA
jgi:hypothetical protein